MIRLFRKCLNSLLKRVGYKVVRDKELIEFYLHEYSSYEQYKKLQVFHNKRKLNNVWADKVTLNRVVELLVDEFQTDQKICGLCHGTRNGFEQKYLNQASKNINAIGTDISDTAKDFDNSFEWDFHDVCEAWHGNQDFVYSNSLDQSWKPKKALETWLSQLKPNGILIIEHTRAHGPEGSSEMDPFGVRPTVLPYVLTMWFGSQISIDHSVAPKDNMDLSAWLFVIRKNVAEVKILD